MAKHLPGLLLYRSVRILQGISSQQIYMLINLVPSVYILQYTALSDINSNILINYPNIIYSEYKNKFFTVDLVFIGIWNDT